ncbi:MAG: hypothetical protein ACFFD3_01655 [Candidatus Thorarchaeota archaeon]
MEIDSPSGTSKRPIRINYRRVFLTIILTSFTAYILSVFGYLPVNPIYATIMGSLIGFLSVIYEFFVGRQMVKQLRSIKESEQGSELT